MMISPNVYFLHEHQSHTPACYRPLSIALVACTATGKARVDFDDGDFMLMEFDSTLSGTCVFDGDVRRYGFKITGPDGESI